MANKSIKRNYIYNVCYQMLLLVAPALTIPHLSRTLGADGIGTVSYAESIVSYFALFAAMGITTYGQREISYVQDSREKRSYVFWNTKLLEIITTSVAIVAYGIFSAIQENPALYFALLLNIVAVLVDITWFFQGMEEFGRIVFRNVIIKTANIIYIFLVIRTKTDVLYYAFGMAFFTFLGNASLWRYLPKYVDKVPFYSLRPFKDFKVVLSLFVPTIAIQVYTVLDRTMIGLITHNPFENGYYEQALKISKMTLMTVSSLTTVMIPRIGYHFEKGELQQVKSFMYRGYRFVWFLGMPLCFGLIMVSSNFVPWFYGAGFEKVAVLLKILALLILAIGINGVTGTQYLVPTKRQNMFTISVIVGAAINFTFNLFLIYFFQSIGAAIASVAAESGIAVLQLYLVRKELSPIRVLRESFPYLIAGTVMIVLLGILGTHLEPSIIHTVILVISGAFVYFFTLLLLRDDFFLTNVKSIMSKIRKRRS